MTNRLPTGKLPPALLAELLAGFPTDPRVVLGPRVGEDAAVLDMGARYLVAKTDPITFATDAIGWYAVQINANDIATTGATPLWFLATVLLPASQATSDLARTIFGQIRDACQSLGVAVVGGHTEITHGLDRPVVVGCMLGEVEKARLVRTGGAQPGDVILLTKGAPIEAVAVIARERRAALADRFDPVYLDHCAAFLTEPGISVVRDARIALEAGGVSAMHDPTEGGLVTALWELAEASDCALVVDLFGADGPWLPEGTALCAAFDLDLASVIASGALLLAVNPASVGAQMDAFRAANIPLFRLGVASGGPATVADRTRGMLYRPERDAITHLFE